MPWSRLFEMIALRQIHSEFKQHSQRVGVFDAFGDGDFVQAARHIPGHVPAAAQDAVTVQPLPPVVNDDSWLGVVQAVSAPRTAANAGARWTRLIFPWDQTEGEPFQSFRVETGVTKGPDQMWYLDTGMLPGDRF